MASNQERDIESYGEPVTPPRRWISYVVGERASRHSYDG